MTRLNELTDLNGTVFNVDTLETLIRDGYISRKFHNKFPLAILNYTPQAQYDAKLVWGFEMNLCRGLIYNTETFEVVARPFSKFWNINDDRHPETLETNLPNEAPQLTDKLDGSLGVLYCWENENYVATRGSFHSEQAEWATTWLQKSCPQLALPEDYTVLVEILYAENQIVVQYDFEGLVVLGIINNSTGVESSRDAVEIWLNGFSDVLHLVEKFDKTLAECAAENVNNREGYVATFSNGLKVKIKFEEYVRLHRVLTGLNVHSIWELLRDGQDKTVSGWLVDPKMPEDFKKWVTGVYNTLYGCVGKIEAETYQIFDARPLLGIMTPYREQRKKMAEYFMKEEHRQYSGLLFSLLDNRCIKDSVWKMVEPKNVKTFKIEGE